MKSVAQGHIARIWQSQDSNSVMIPIPVPFPAYHVASKDCSSLFTGKLFLSTPHPPTPSFLKRCLCFHEDYIHCPWNPCSYLCLWGGILPPACTQINLGKKSINAVADVQI